MSERRQKRKAVRCIVVLSERDPGLLSIRPLDVKPTEGGKGTTLKKRITETFRVGDLVSIVLSPDMKRVRQRVSRRKTGRKPTL